MNPEDMGDSPLHNTTTHNASIDTRFQPGVSGNPNGRPKGTKTGPRSKMRSQLIKMCELQPDAIEILKIQMTGKNSAGEFVPEPSKEKVDMAKFVVKAIESLNNTCLREEMAILGVRNKDEEGAKQLADNQADKEASNTGSFSLDMATQH